MVSVIIPCFNERQHIEECILSILRQKRPTGGLEIIIADGFSQDGTRDILNRLKSKYSELRVVDNPQRITPCAMNAGIREARGQYVAILGAHCSYASDYLSTCIELLNEHPDVSCSGGPILSKGKSFLGQAVAAAMSHPVGIGNARHRHPHFEGYAEGACYPVFRREVFDTIGLYDESLVRNQDDELNYRLAKHNLKVFLSPRARSVYFVRETLGSLFRQYYEYGFWRVAVLRKHFMPASLRQVVPPLFLGGLVGSFALALLLPPPFGLAMLAGPSIYALVLCGVGLNLSRQAEWPVALLFPVAAATMHIAYAIGFLRGIVYRGPSATPRNKA